MNAEEIFGGLTQEIWDRLAGRHFYSTSAWLRYCAADTDVPGTAVVAHSRDEPVWAVPIRELSKLPLWSRYRWNDHLKEFGLPLLADTGTLVGPPEGFQTHFLSAEGVRPPAALSRLVADLRVRSGSDKDGDERACVAMYVTSEDVRAVREAGVTAEPVLLDVDAWIPVPERGWPAWLGTLPAKRARNIKREDQRFREAGYCISHMPLAECADRLGGASAATLRKYGHETTVSDEAASIRRVADCMGEAARVAVCSLADGDPIGFCIYYVWADTVFLRWAGFDYERLVGAAEYFNLLYYSQVKRAPEGRVRWIHAGATAHAAKALRGAELRPLWLLDLSEDSVLARCAEQVREHNVRLYARFADDPRVASALVSDVLWDP